MDTHEHGKGGAPDTAGVATLAGNGRGLADDRFAARRLAEQRCKSRADKAARCLERVVALKATFADYWFTDAAGGTRRISLGSSHLDERAFEGVLLDGRTLSPSLGGRLMLQPDPEAIYLDPVAPRPTAVVFCSVRHDRDRPVIDPRSTLERAVSEITKVLPGATPRTGAEVEFHLVTSEGSPATEAQTDVVLRGLHESLANAGVDVSWLRVGPGPACGRVQMVPHGALKTADQVQLYKYAAGSIARRKGLEVTLLARPFEDSVAGLPLHLSLHHTAGDQHSFHDARHVAGLSDLARRFAAGWLHHAPALMAWCAPTENSYRRLATPDGPVRRTLSASDGRALCRVPAGSTSSGPEVRRLKFCGADPSCNPYLAVAALLAAGLDGVERLPPAELDAPAVLPHLPACLETALRALAEGAGFLSRAGVSQAAVDADAAARFDTQVLPVRRVPHPAERALERRLAAAAGGLSRGGCE